MPFTLAHPAAVVFLKNKKLNITALILGSMAPDFLYFINFRPYGNLGHKLLGFFLLNLPLCFLLAYVFHNIIKSQLISNLPNPFDKWYFYLREKKFSLNSLKEVIVFIYSAILGMATHVLWDAFTHNSGFFVEKIPYLREKILFLGEYEIYRYKFFQHGSTLIGIFIIVFFLYILKDSRKIVFIKRISFKKKIKYYFSISIIMFLVVFFSYFIFREFNISYGIGGVVVSILNGLFLGMFIISFKENLNMKNKG